LLKKSVILKPSIDYEFKMYNLIWTIFIEYISLREEI